MSQKRSEIFAVDFDGSVVTERYEIENPSLHGVEAPFAVMVLKMLVTNGHRIVLWTLRDGHHLTTAERWFGDRDIPLFGVNDHTDRWNTPTEKKSPKVPATMYIDDRALGAPKRKIGEETVLCWEVTALHLHDLGYLTNEQFNLVKHKAFEYDESQQ